MRSSNKKSGSSICLKFMRAPSIKYFQEEHQFSVECLFVYFLSFLHNCRAAVAFHNFPFRFSSFVHLVVRGDVQFSGDSLTRMRAVVCVCDSIETASRITALLQVFRFRNSLFPAI